MTDSTWGFPLNLEPGKSRTYALKVKVAQCVPAGTLTLTTAVGLTDGPDIKVGDGLSVWRNKRDAWRHRWVVELLEMMVAPL